MPNWTKPQTDAITDRGGSLLISAAAGSGKTTVLVERAMRLICEGETPVTADSLLIMTFTNAAAAELRGRIATEIEKRIKKEPRNSWLQKQRLLIRRAQIGTVDSFCKQLVLENFNVLNVPSDVRVASDAEINDIKTEVLAQVVEEKNADPNFTAFAEVYGRSRNDAICDETILKLYGYLSSFPNREAQINVMENLYKNPLSLEVSLWGKQILAEAKVICARLLKYYNIAIRLVDMVAALEPYHDVLNSEFVFAKRIDELLLKNDFDGAVKLLQALSFGRLPTIKKSEIAEKDIVTKDSVKQLRDDAKKLFKTLGERVLLQTQEEYEEDLQFAAPMVLSVLDGCRSFTQKFYEAKISEKMLEFSDFEHLALSLLVDENNNKTDFAKSLCKKYSYVMVDEYQDTNEIQNLIYENLANDQKSNLFFVGDIKQSIYRFRQANPEIFIGKKDSFAKYDGKNYPSAIILGDNFRSSEKVINGINDIFEKIMSREVGGINYDDTEKLYAGTTGLPSASVQLHIVDCAESGENSDAQYIATLIKKMIDEKAQIRTKTGTADVKAGDFAILLRSANVDGTAYAQALENIGIPAFVGAEGNILQTAEIKPLLALLRVIDNPCNDVNMSAVLLGPLYDFGADELTIIRSEMRTGRLFTALGKSENEKAQEFLAWLSRLQTFAAAHSLADLVSHILSLTEYEAITGAMENGVARRENLHKFSAYVASYGGIGGLSGFLRMVDNALEKGTKTAGGSKTAPVGFVNIMSIHASKGLEFPVCIVAALHKKFNMRDTMANVLLDERLGLGINLKNKNGTLYRTVPHEAIASRIKKEQLSEEMRVLYVALTRAKDTLVMTLASKTPEALIMSTAQDIIINNGFDTYSLQTAQGFGKWILGACMQNEGGRKLWDIAGLACPFTQMSQPSIEVILGKAQPLDEESKKEDFAFKCTANEKLVQKITGKFGQNVKTDKQDTLPIKTSVSALSHKNIGNVILKRPSFMYKTGLTAAEKGTAMHAFLQYADLKAAKTDFKSEVNRMVEKQFLPLTVAEKIDNAQVQIFLESDLCEKMIECEKLLREYDFITSVDARLLDETQDENATIYVQGIADCVIINGTQGVLVDYKTDRGKTAEELASTYEKQLILYKNALEKRLDIKITKCIIYSLSLGEEIIVC